MEKNNHIIKLKIRTWEISTNGIFYYKPNRNILSSNISIKNENTTLIRNKDCSYKIIDNICDFNEKEDEEILFKFRKSFKNKFYEIINPVRKINKININENYLNNLDNKIWYPLKSTIDTNCYYDENNEDYILNENDIIKLGRIKYEVIKKHINIKNDKIENNYKYNISKINRNAESLFNNNIKPNQYKVFEKIINKNKNEKNKNISNFNHDQTSLIDNSAFFDKTRLNIEENDFENEKCKICHEFNSTIENPKICLCKCNEYVHFECLKKYLNLKIEIHKSKDIISYYCNKFNCDICLYPYPIRFKIPEFNKIYELIDINMPEESNYIILESLDYIKDNHNIKKIHIVSLGDKEINIGRKDSNDIIDNDLSVSRYHAVLKFDKENGNLYLENKSEKFGTLVLIKGNLKIKEENINIQIGKSFIMIKHKKSY